MADLFENPIGTRGFEFLEFADAGPDALDALFRAMGFAPTKRHRTAPITLYEQNNIRFFLNTAGEGQAKAFRDAHTRGASAMAFRVDDARAAYEAALARGAEPAEETLWPSAVEIPAVKGIGETVIYLIDAGLAERLYAEDFEPLSNTGPMSGGAGLAYVDHLTHNVQRGNMGRWAAFYEKVFNFREIRYFDIEGKLTGLVSKAMTSPDGNIRIPLNESQDDKSQIEEFLREYNGEGIQHIALAATDIYASVDALRARDVPFQDTPDTYYDAIDERVAGHGEDVERLRKTRILIDGAPTEGQGLLLQIFTQNAIGPIFFEIIQRKGNEGFGEGNFKALFESIELDQIRRGVLQQDA